jgi:site-specific DNA-methyltransferase (adenine-specific)
MECSQGLKLLPDNCIDLTITSPPYDNMRTYTGYEWDFQKIARELFRVTKLGGVVVWVVADETVKGSETGTSFKQALYFKECGFNLHDTMVFVKENPMPTKAKRYTSAFEYMFVLSKGAPKTFNPIMEKCKLAGKKAARTKINRDGTRTPKNYGVYRDEKIKANVFQYAVGAVKGIKHPAVFPERLARDHIISWSNPGDVVLDPFMGSGTTAKMALLNDRSYIGFEISEEYCRVAQQRIAEAKNNLLGVTDI